MKVRDPNSLSRLYHTVKHLRWRQIYYRFKYRLSFWSRPSTSDKLTISPKHKSDDSQLRKYRNSLRQLYNKEEIERGLFRFINLKEKTTFPPDWEFPSPNKLWLYQLHYFEWIFCLDYEDAKRCTKDWINNYQFTRNRDGWEPYPTSLRLISWCIYFFTIQQNQLRKDPAFSHLLSESIQTQTNWLERRLEYHLLANHLFENAAALSIVGYFFEGAHAERWLQKGARILNQEIKEQILPDGMHFERSPMYHQRMLQVLQEVSLSYEGDERNQWQETIERMQQAFDYTRHPDGEIALLNDSSFNVYPLPLKHHDHSKLIFGNWQLPDAGYFGYSNEEGNYIVIDGGSIGPDYNPGHAHGDIFSYEMSWNHKRFIVDSGNFDYEPGSMRDYCRSTKAHNTVAINRKDQCDFWGTFRVGKRGKPENVKVIQTQNGFQFKGDHNAYERISARVKHTRIADFDHKSGLMINDSIESIEPVDAVSRVHFHPECTCGDLKDGQMVVTRGEVRCVISWDHNSVAKLEDSYYCPEFNVRQNNKALALFQHGSDLKIKYKIKFMDE